MKKIKKLKLSRDTVRVLDDPAFSVVVGGRMLPTSNEETCKCVSSPEWCPSNPLNCKGAV